MAKINQWFKDILNMYPYTTIISYIIWALISGSCILHGTNDAVIFWIVISYIVLTIAHILCILCLWALIKVLDYYDYY